MGWLLEEAGRIPAGRNEAGDEPAPPLQAVRPAPNSPSSVK
jgi:hypothetical protein